MNNKLRYGIMWIPDGYLLTIERLWLGIFWKFVAAVKIKDADHEWERKLSHDLPPFNVWTKFGTLKASEYNHGFN